MKNIKLILFNLFIFFLSIYLLTASGPNAYRTDAAQLRFEITKSIIERNDINVPEKVGIKGSDGRYYSWLGIGSAIVAIPFYLAGLIFKIPPKITIQLLNQVFGAATVILIFLFVILLGYSRLISLLVAFAYGLGTIAWPYAKYGYDHILETFFILLSFYFICSYGGTKKALHLLLSAASIGFAFIVRTTSIVAAPSLFFLMIAYCFKASDFKISVKIIVQNSVLMLIAFLPFFLVNLWYNYYRFDSIFETGYQLIAQRTHIDNFSYTTFLSGLEGFLISPGKGFFFYSPIAILFFFSIRSFIKRHACIGYAFLLFILCYLFLYSCYVFWHGDWAWGPRYLLSLTPFLIIPIADFFHSDIIQKHKVKPIICLIFILSVIIQFTAVSVDYHNYFFHVWFFENTSFIEASGAGVRPIIVPPDDIYNNWEYSPIIYQFMFIYKILKDINNFKYEEPPPYAHIIEELRVHPSMKIFDFWWLYIYLLTGAYFGVIIAFVLFVTAIYSASRIWKYNACI